jgi:choline dehydrogenase-like flavoprotein
MHCSADEFRDTDRVDADVCVAGAGPAGIAVALELESRGLEVVLLDQGASSLDGDVDGSYPALHETRAGGIGGSAALWNAELMTRSFGARHGRLTPRDLETRNGITWAGWPFGVDELDRWYDRAADICGLAPLPGNPVDVGGSIVDHILGFSPASMFLETHRLALYGSRRIQVIEPATALSLRVDANGVASELSVAIRPGRMSVRARAFILALGGIENARFLLLNDLGNENDLVGRFFMDHPTARCELKPHPAASLARYDVKFGTGRAVVRTLGLGEKMLSEAELGAGAMFIVPAPGRDERALEAAGSVWRRLRGRQAGAVEAGALRTIVTAPDVFGLESYRRLSKKFPALGAVERLSPRAQLRNTLAVGTTAGWSRLRRVPDRFDVHHVIEQFPEYERRITLGERRDSLGRSLPSLRFFISDAEIDSLERTQDTIKCELERLRIGTLSTTRDLVGPDRIRESIHPSAHHHLGTTRMDRDPKRGVVDADGRLHSSRNVYVTGGSVFPTGGYVNPTLTIVALAARLGAHVAAHWERV